MMNARRIFYNGRTVNMAIRNIRKEGDDILRMKCKDVAEVTDSTRRLIDDMFETMKTTAWDWRLRR